MIPGETTNDSGFLSLYRNSHVLTFPVFALIAGELAGFNAPGFARHWIAIGVLSTAIALLSFAAKFPCRRLLAAFLLGFTLSCRCQNAYSDIGRAAAERTRLEDVDVLVEKTGSPRTKTVSFLGRSDGSISLSVIIPYDKYSQNPLPRPGEIWRCSGYISSPQNSSAPLPKLRLYATGHNAARCISVSDNPWSRISDYLSKCLSTGLEKRPDIANLNSAILLGRRSGMSRDHRKMFSSAGTIHVFAVSGLHVVLIAAIFTLVLRRAGFSKNSQALLAIPLTLAYALTTGAKPSAMRAAAMAAMYLAAPVFNRRPDGLAAWSITAFAMYSISPEKVFDVGCALSFTVMLSIVLFARWFRTFPVPFGFLIQKARMARTCGNAKMGALYITLQKGLSFLTGSAVISFAAWAAGAPLIAAVFGIFSTGGLIANILVIPLVGATVLFGVLAMISSFISDALCAIFNIAAGISTSAMVSISEAVANSPLAGMQIEPWSPLKCLSWYAALIAICTLVNIFINRKRHGLSWLANTGDSNERNT